MEPYNLQPPDINSPANNSPGFMPPPPPEEFSTKHSWFRFLQEKGIALPVLLIIIVPILFAMIVYRYDIYGLLKQQNYTAEIVDSHTGQPLIGAEVTLKGHTVKTNDFGEATFGHVKVGKTPIAISQLNYSSYQVITLVTFTDHRAHVFGLKNIGTEVQLSVDNKITQAPIQGAIVSADNVAVVTNAKGLATMNLPASQTTLNATISADNYNLDTVLMNAQTKNPYSIIPTGKVYYISNSLPDSLGTWSLIKSNIDGSSQQVILGGGKAAALTNSQILDSSDSKYVAVSIPDSQNVQTLYVYNTQNGNLVTIDQSSASDFINGWTPDDILIYTATAKVGSNGYSQASIMGYKATSPKAPPYTLDQARSNGDDGNSASQETYSSVNVLGDDYIELSKYYLGSGNDTTAGSIDTALATDNNYGGTNSLQPLNYSSNYTQAPKVVYTSPTSLVLAFTNSTTKKVSYYTYAEGKASAVSGSSVADALNYPPASSPYYLSPSGAAQMWSRVNGNSTTIYVGNKKGLDGVAVANLGNSYTPYGWWSDNYILLDKSGSGLYIMPASGSSNQNKIQEVAAFIP
jgi:hypothetical protein